MKTFEVTLRGYDADYAETDDLVKWVKAPDLRAVEEYVASHTDWEGVEIWYLEGRDNQIADEECDIILPEAFSNLGINNVESC
jgi:hypothetical protein